ncbi:MAG: hypothetical protein L6265_06210 [Thermoplasmatales archaeon]|nr:hypothetical protein [Thermoplasmatales archaeon]
MNKKHIKIIAEITVIIVCTASIGYIAYSGVWVEWITGEWRNEYDFFISLYPKEPVYNVTLYLPILMVKGEVSSLMFQMDYPSNWTWNITETEHGKMLKISADFISVEGNTIRIRVKTGHVVNTQNPVGNEPVLYPRYNETPTEHEIEITAKYEYQSYMYAEYNTSTTNKLSVGIWMEGSKYRTYSLPYPGSQGASYTDRIYYTIIGGSQGWHAVNGTLQIGGRV